MDQSVIWIYVLKGEIISYGNYDEDSYRLFDTRGEGVLISTNKESYIPFCIEHNKKTLFGFGIQLNEQQRAGIRQEIKKLKKTAILGNLLELAEKKKILTVLSKTNILIMQAVSTKQHIASCINLKKALLNIILF